MLVAIGAGGIAGAEGRYGLSLALPHSTGVFPVSTLVINVTGCALIGVLMVVLLELTAPHRLVRPLLGVGVLGGYTTYSTFAVDVEQLLLTHRPLAALLYCVATVARVRRGGLARYGGHPGCRKSPRHPPRASLQRARMTTPKAARLLRPDLEGDGRPPAGLQRGSQRCRRAHPRRTRLLDPIVTPLLIAVGALLGAPARYLTDRALQARHTTGFPWGTMTVNIAASMLLGLLTGASQSEDMTALIGTGFCGALSTYSTFSYETMRLVQEGARFHAIVNVGVSLIAGIGGAALGYSIGTSLN